MKKLVLLPALALSAGLCAAQGELARVVSATPVMQQVAVPRQVCTEQPVVTTPSRSGAGAVLGAIAGGAIGNSIGHGSGRAAATVIGAISGAAIGDRIEGSGSPSVQQVQQCSTQTFYETRVTSYNVVYEYAGRQYTVQMPNDPGPTIRVQVTPVGGVVQKPVTQVVTTSYEPVYVQPAYVAVPVVPTHRRHAPPRYYRDPDERWERHWDAR